MSAQTQYFEVDGLGAFPAFVLLLSSFSAPSASSPTRRSPEFTGARAPWPRPVHDAVERTGASAFWALSVAR
jgi:hypothetical protein